MLVHGLAGRGNGKPAFPRLPQGVALSAHNDHRIAMLAGYTVVDPATVIATHLTEVFKRHLADFLDRQAVQGLLDTVAKHSPKAVEDLVPGVLPLGVVQKVLQLLVRENVSVRDMKQKIDKIFP